MMAQSREIIDEAYAGDIIGVFDPGIFSIGDTICSPGHKVQFRGIPTFAPEHFALVRQKDTMKRKQFIKGTSQIAQEGAIQIFQELDAGMEEVIVGVVGVLAGCVGEVRLQILLVIKGVIANDTRRAKPIAYQEGRVSSFCLA